MERIEALKYIGKTRFGDIETLEMNIGKNFIDSFIEEGFIQRGKEFPNIWRITEKGKFRSRAVSSRFLRFIAKLIWKFQK